MKSGGKGQQRKPMAWKVMKKVKEKGNYIYMGSNGKGQRKGQCKVVEKLQWIRQWHGK